MMEMERIYLDHAATTPLHPDVLAAMLPYLTESFGNASSVHGFGRHARLAVDRARDYIAQQLACSPGELLFTSGGTESDNMAILGVVRAWKEKQAKKNSPDNNVRPHLITSRIEHHAVLHAVEAAQREHGCDVTYVDVDTNGMVDVEAVRAAIRPGQTILISVMWGNNEVGTLQPIQAIGEVARANGVLLHVDAVQALGHVAIKLRDMPVDLASFSAHKINGPQGIGALYVRQGTAIAPMLFGGSQEKRRRAGTENVAAIVGFAAAVRLHTEIELSELSGCLTPEQLRQFFLDGLKAEIPGHAYSVNTPLEHALPHILNVSFPGIKTETMLMNLDLAGIAAASGSACSSGSLEVSHVLKAMNLSEDRLESAIRFSFGLQLSDKSLTNVIQTLKMTIQRLHSRL
jgi:cysteine desulfurase